MSHILPVPRAYRRTRRTREELDASAWMRGYNPLRNLTVTAAQMIFDTARRGCDVRLQWIYDNIEAADPTLMICAERRSGALNGLDWMIRQKSAARSRAFDEALAAEQVAYLEAAYGEADDTNLSAAIERLATAFFRGHAHVSPVYSDAGKSLRGFELLDAWNVCRDVATGSWHWNPTASEVADPLSLPEIPRGEMCSVFRLRHIDYPAMAIYLRNALGERAWGQFLERYGIPPVIITMPQDIDPSRVTEYMDAAAKVAEGGNGALPYGSTVNYATEARGTDPFSEYLRHQQELIVLMATGGTLTSLTGATGIGQGATDAHEETWRTIVRSDAAVIADELNRTVTDALLDRAFPGRPHLAQFAFETEPPMSPAEVFDIASKAVAAGYRLTREELEKRTGMALESVPAAPAADPFGGGLTLNRAEPGLPGATEPAKDTAPRADLEALADALRADLSPAADAVMDFLRNPSPQAARTLAERLPLLLPDDPETAAVIEQVMAEALAETLSASTPVKNTASECHAKDPDNCPYHGGKQADDIGEYEAEKRGINPDSAEVQNAEIGKGKAALKRCLEEKTDVYDAIARSDLGTISFIYGDERRGIAHFMHRKEALKHLPETLIRGKSSGPYEEGRKCNLTYGDYTAVLRLQHDGKEDRWVVTAFRPQDQKKEGSPR